MLIYPTLHYQNGGLEFKETGETGVPGLFVAGEVGGGIHGANRLMGNSLLDIIVFGRIAGTSAAEFIATGLKEGALTPRPRQGLQPGGRGGGGGGRTGVPGDHPRLHQPGGPRAPAHRALRRQRSIDSLSRGGVAKPPFGQPC